MADVCPTCGRRMIAGSQAAKLRFMIAKTEPGNGIILYKVHTRSKSNYLALKAREIAAERGLKIRSSYVQRESKLYLTLYEP